MTETGRATVQHVSRHVADRFVMVLLVLGFFLGPLKMIRSSWASYLAPDLLAVLVLGLVVAERISARKPLLARSPLTVPIVLLAGYCFLELANPGAPFIRSVIGLRSWVLYLLFYFVGFYSFRSVRQIERLYGLLIALGVVTAAYGVYQWKAGPQAFANWSEAYGHYAQVMWSMGSSGVVFRAFSTFVLPNTFGNNMAVVMLLAMSVAASGAIPVRWRIAATAAFALMGVGIAASGSRAPVALLLLCGAVGLAFVAGGRLRLKIGVLGGALAALAMIFVLLVIGSVVRERFASMFDPTQFFWKWFYPLTIGIRLAWAHPFGMGLGYTAGVPTFITNPVLRELPMLSVDSGYGSAAAELGFVGLGLFAYFAVRVSTDAIRTWSSLQVSRLRDLLLGPTLLAATYPIVSVIFMPQSALPISTYSWLLVGMLMKAPLLERRADEDSLLRTALRAGQ